MCDDQSPSRSREYIDPFNIIDPGGGNKDENETTDMGLPEDFQSIEGNQADILMYLLKQYDENSLAPQVYYFIHKYASSQNASIDAIADVRDIQSSSVEKEIRNVEENIDLPNVS